MSVTVLLDGSNALFWRGGQVGVDVPELIIRALIARRFIVRVYFDNSIRRHLEQSRLDHLSTIADVLIAPRGTSADAMLLNGCGQGRIQIVSNDRFRAWRGDYPNLQKGWLVTGSIGKKGRVNFSKRLRPAPL